MREAARRHPRLLAQRLAQRQPTTTLSAALTCLGEPQLALALCHRVGRVRQKALRPSARHPALLPLLVIRCADWAAPVREAARRLLREALDMDNAPASRRSSSASAAATKAPSPSICSHRSCAGPPPRTTRRSPHRPRPRRPPVRLPAGRRGPAAHFRRSGPRGLPGRGHRGPGPVRHRGARSTGRGGGVRGRPAAPAVRSQPAGPFGRRHRAAPGRVAEAGGAVPRRSLRTGVRVRPVRRTTAGRRSDGLVPRAVRGTGHPRTVPPGAVIGPAECGNRADAGRDQRVAGEDGEGGLGAKPARLRPPDQDGAGR